MKYNKYFLNEFIKRIFLEEYFLNKFFKKYF